MVNQKLLINYNNKKKMDNSEFGQTTEYADDCNQQECCFFLRKTDIVYEILKKTLEKQIFPMEYQRKTDGKSKS